MTKKNFALLGLIVASMANAEKPYHMATTAELKGLIADKFVETNADITEGTGAAATVATRATEAGTAAYEAEKAKGEKPPVEAPSLTIGSGFVVPEGAKRTKTELYPFDTLAVGGFIFVPASESKPDPAKSLASTVSAATKRYAQEIPGQTREDRNGKTVPATVNTRVFQVVPVKAGVVYGEFTAPSDGAAIVRIADHVPADAAATA